MAMAENTGVGRRGLLTGALAIGGMAGLSSRAAAQTAAVPYRGRRLVPMRMTVNELIEVRSCVRPFRPQGCKLDAEQIGDTLVVHNYGHGGSGWSLSWGSAEIAVGKAMSALPTEIAVVGCGIVGLTAAIHAQRAGAKVTIYAREMYPRTRSVRAGGVWSPDSRISLTEPAGPAFAVLWEQMARISWKHWRGYLGMPERPVEFSDNYALSDTPPKPREEHADPAITQNYANSGMPHQDSEFARYSDRIKDIIPHAVDLPPEENPFNTPFARRTETLHYNFNSYGKLLLSEFFAMGGKFENRDFHSPADIVALKQKVVINSPGYAARDLWRDKTIIPVRGQNGSLIPQPECNYGVSYRGGSATPKTDGVIVSHNATTLGDMEGVGDSRELPNRAQVEEGIALLAPAFVNMKGALT
jgi:hypothetical protein